MRIIGSKTLTLVALLATLAVAGCNPLAFFAGNTRPTPAAVQAVTPTAVVMPTPTPLPTVTPTPTPVPGVSQSEAEQLVRSYFQALDNADYRQMQALTAGSARDTTDGLLNQVQQAEQANNVKITAQTKTLDVDGSQEQGTGRVVKAHFATDIVAQTGFFAVPARTLQGQATFLVQRVDGQAKIIQIDGDLR